MEDTVEDYSSDDEEEGEVKDDTGRWRLLDASDFNIESSKDNEDYAMMLRCQLVTTDPSVKLKVKKKRSTHVWYQVYCTCSGKHKGKGSTERYRTSKKVGCSLSLMLQVSRSGSLMSKVESSDLVHSNHDNEYKSSKHFDGRVPLESVYPKALEIEEMLNNLDLSQVTSFRHFLVSIQTALLEGKRLDKRSQYYLKLAYARRVNKDFRPSTTLEMIQELYGDQEKYYCMPLRAEYDSNKVTKNSYTR